MSKPWRVTFNGVHESTGVQIVNVIHFATDEEPLAGNASAQDVADKVDDVFSTLWREMATTEVRLQTIIAREELAPGDTSVPEEAAATVDALGIRSAGSSSLPLAFCGLINCHTDAAVRSGHGWIFCPPMQKADDLTGAETIDPASIYWNTMVNFGTAVKNTHQIGTVVVHDLHAVVYSHTRRARGDAQYWFDIKSAVPRPRPTWLRSRQTSP